MNEDVLEALTERSLFIFFLADMLWQVQGLCYLPLANSCEQLAFLDTT